MNKQTLITRLNTINGVTATCKDSFLKICIPKFLPMWVNLESDTYSANCLPPMPPLEYRQNANTEDYDLWNDVFYALSEYDWKSA